MSSSRFELPVVPYYGIRCIIGRNTEPKDRQQIKIQKDNTKRVKDENKAKRKKDLEKKQKDPPSKRSKWPK